MAFFVLSTVYGVQSASGRYGTELSERLQGASWIFPFIAPMLSIMISVSTIVKRSADAKIVSNTTLFRLCYWSSLFYVAILLLVPLSEPFWPHRVTFSDMFPLFSIVFGSLQAVILGMVSKFFIENI